MTENKKPTNIIKNVIRSLKTLFSHKSPVYLILAMLIILISGIICSYFLNQQNNINTVNIIYENLKNELQVKDAKFYYNEGLRKVEDGNQKGGSSDYHGAIEDYNKAIKLNSKYAKAFYKRGNAKCNIYSLKGAIEDYNQAIKLNLKDNIVYYYRGNAKYKLEDYRGAIKDYKEYIKITHNKRAYEEIGFAKEQLGDYKGAIEAYNEAIIDCPDWNNSYYDRGANKAIIGDYKGAIEDYNEAKSNPTYIGTYDIPYFILELADTCSLYRDSDKLISLNPKFAKAFYSSGLNKSNLKDYTGAIKDFNKAKELDSNLIEKIDAEIEKIKKLHTLK